MPDVPFCAAGKVATAVVLARRSAPERIRPAAPTTPAAERGSACCSAGAGGLPRLLLLLRPYRRGYPEPRLVATRVDVSFGFSGHECCTWGHRCPMLDS